MGSWARVTPRRAQEMPGAGKLSTESSQPKAAFIMFHLPGLLKLGTEDLLGGPVVSTALSMQLPGFSPWLGIRSTITRQPINKSKKGF